MILTIDLDTMGTKKRYRLTRKSFWRRVEGNNDLKDYDQQFLSNQRKEVADFIRKPALLTLAGVPYYANSENLDEDVERYATLHRSIKPKRFDREQLAKVISEGDDSIPSSLAIDIRGRFKLIDPLQMNSPEPYEWFNQLSYAVITEPFEPERGFLGEDAAKNKDHIEVLYLANLTAWEDHLHIKRYPLFLNEDNYRDLELMSEERSWEAIDKLFE